MSLCKRCCWWFVFIFTIGYKHITMLFCGSHTRSFKKISPTLLYTFQMHLKNLWKMKWEAKIYIFISPTMKTLHRKDQYWTRNGLYTVGYIQCYNPNFYGYEFFSSCEIEKASLQLWKTLFWKLLILRWKNQEIRGLSFFIQFKLHPKITKFI